MPKQDRHGCRCHIPKPVLMMPPGEGAIAPRRCPRWIRVVARLTHVQPRHRANGGGR
jgi:hypothetical protein